MTFTKDDLPENINEQNKTKTYPTGNGKVLYQLLKPEVKNCGKMKLRRLG